MGTTKQMPFLRYNNNPLFSAWYKPLFCKFPRWVFVFVVKKLEQFEVLKVVLLKIQLFGMLNHCSASSS
jgi:hypothetical protein